MRFQFSLEPVLRVAEVRENCEWKRLQEIQAQKVATTLELQRTIDSQLTVRRQALADVATQTSSAWLRLSVECVNAMQRREHALRQQLWQLTKQFEEQHVAYVAERRRREVLSRLRETRYAEFRHELAKQQQAELDEIFLNLHR